MFADATAYDRMMGRWSARLAPLFLEFTGASAGRILDVGCGTGSLVQALAERQVGSEITGIDPVAPFIDHCRQRFAGPTFSFDCGNGMDLPYADNYFHHALSLLVFAFIPQPATALAEMRRVTRPGGVVAACTWDSGGGGLEMSGILWQEARKLDPAAEARAEKALHLNRRGELAQLWQATGLENVREIAIDLQTDFTSFDDYWLPYTGGAGAPGAYVASLSPERRVELREALRKRLLGGLADGPISLRARAWAVRGTLPA